MFLHYLIYNWQHMYGNIQCIFYTMENAPLKSLLTKPGAVKNIDIPKSVSVFSNTENSVSPIPKYLVLPRDETDIWL